MTTSFPHLPVLSHQGSTLNWEKLAKEYNQPWKVIGRAGEPAFEHAWENFEAGGKKAEYRKVFGIVYLRGRIKTGESAKSAFILPVGYRPKGNIGYIVEANENSGRVVAESSGAIVPVNLGGEVKLGVPLDQVFFSVE